MFETKIGIDLGTSNILGVLKNKGIIINEPTVIAIDNATNKILAVGSEASQMIGREPAGISVIQPLSQGVISNYSMTKAIIKYYITLAKGKFGNKINITIGIPSSVTEVERRAFKDAALEAGAKKVHLLEESIAGAIGSEIDVNEPYGRLVVDIGGGTTDVAVISLGGIVESFSLKLAGNDFDAAIINYIRRYYNVVIGDSSAELIKKKVGSVWSRDPEVSIDVTGRDLVTGLPKTIPITSRQTIDIFKDISNRIVDTIYSVLEITPPELAADIYEGGILLTGGGSLIYGLSELIEDKLGIHTFTTDNPMASVALGLKTKL